MSSGLSTDALPGTGRAASQTAAPESDVPLLRGSRRRTDGAAAGDCVLSPYRELGLVVRVDADGTAHYRLADGALSCAGRGFRLPVVARIVGPAAPRGGPTGNVEALLARLDGLEIASVTRDPTGVRHEQ